MSFLGQLNFFPLTSSNKDCEVITSKDCILQWPFDFALALCRSFSWSTSLSFSCNQWSPSPHPLWLHAVKPVLSGPVLIEHFLKSWQSFPLVTETLTRANYSAVTVTFSVVQTSYFLLPLSLWNVHFVKVCRTSEIDTMSVTVSGLLVLSFGTKGGRNTLSPTWQVMDISVWHQFYFLDKL